MYLSETNEISFSERNVFITPKCLRVKKNLQDRIKKTIFATKTQKMIEHKNVIDEEEGFFDDFHVADDLHDSGGAKHVQRLNRLGSDSQ